LCQYRPKIDAHSCRSAIDCIIPDPFKIPTRPISSRGTEPVISTGLIWASWAMVRAVSENDRASTGVSIDSLVDICTSLRLLVSATFPEIDESKLTKLTSTKSQTARGEKNAFSTLPSELTQALVLAPGRARWLVAKVSPGSGAIIQPRPQYFSSRVGEPTLQRSIYRYCFSETFVRTTSRCQRTLKIFESLLPRASRYLSIKYSGIIALILDMKFRKRTIKSAPPRWGN